MHPESGISIPLSGDTKELGRREQPRIPPTVPSPKQRVSPNPRVRTRTDIERFLFLLRPQSSIRLGYLPEPAMIPQRPGLPGGMPGHKAVLIHNLRLPAYQAQSLFNSLAVVIIRKTVFLLSLIGEFSVSQIIIYIHRHT